MALILSFVSSDLGHLLLLSNYLFSILVYIKKDQCQMLEHIFSIENWLCNQFILTIKLLI